TPLTQTRVPSTSSLSKCGRPCPLSASGLRRYVLGERIPFYSRIPLSLSPPRIVAAERPQVAFRVAAAVAGAAVVLLLAVVHDQRAGGLGLFVVGPAVGDDHIGALGFAAADLVGLGDAPAERVVAHAAQHQHAVAVHELGVRHAAGIVVVNRMFLEAEGAAQPV